MKVTITLGPEALEFVTGIPEEELPEILSDVVERSLREQVRPLSPAKSNPVNDSTAEILNQLRDLLVQAKINQTSNAQDNGESAANNVAQIKDTIAQVATSIKLDGNDLIDLGEFGDLMK